MRITQCDGQFLMSLSAQEASRLMDACAVVVLVGALDSSVPSVVDCVLAGAVDAGTVVLSAVALLTSVGVLVVVASLMVFGWLVF